jgi:hypothetical protein
MALSYPCGHRAIPVGLGMVSPKDLLPDFAESPVTEGMPLVKGSEQHVNWTLRQFHVNENHDHGKRLLVRSNKSPPANRVGKGRGGDWQPDLHGPPLFLD